MSLRAVPLLVVGGRHSWGRLLGLVIGVAVGCALFLTLWGASTGLQAREQRSAWLNQNSSGTPEPGGTQARLIDATVLAATGSDFYAGAFITRLDLAVTPASTITLPDGSKPPAPGQYYASPALAELVASVPTDQLGDRYGTLVGTLPDSIIASPDSLVAVVGQTPAELASRASPMPSLAGQAYGGNNNYRVAAIIGSIALLLPVLLLVSVVTKLGAAQRQENFSTLRLLGATPGTVSAISAAESAVTSLVGAVLGLALAYLTRPVAAMIQVNGESFFTSDLSVSLRVIATVVALIVIASALVAAYRITTSGIGPLGVTRQQHERPPSRWRLLLLAAGPAVMLAATTAGPTSFLHKGIDTVLIAGFITTAVGIILAGPFLTAQASRVATRRATTAAAVIASNRISRTPAATFRSVSGLVITVFVVSVFAGAASTVAPTSEVASGAGLLPPTSLLARLDYTITKDQHLAAAHAVGAVDGVAGTVTGYAAPDDGNDIIIAHADAASLGFSHLPASAWLAVDPNALLAADPPQRADLTAATITGNPALTPVMLFVQTDGSTSTIERARTLLESSGITLTGAGPPMTRAEMVDSSTRTMINSFAALAYLAMAIATLIAGVSLTVATIASILDRKRVMGLLRLIGMPVSSLRRIITLET
ncbi:MAG: FtsX-like permease family protein, partial [Mycobacteriaceae bacterium]